MDNNFEQNKASQTFSGSQGGVPPSPSVNVRTMESDQKSMAENGGGQPVPEKINITSIPGNDPKVSFSNFNDGSKNSSFTPPVPPPPKPPTQTGAVSPSPMPPKKKSSIGLIIVLVVILIVLIVGGYVVYSMFLSKPASAPVSSGFPLLPPTSSLESTSTSTPTISSSSTSTVNIATQTLNIAPSIFKNPVTNLKINLSTSSTLSELKSSIINSIPTNISTSSTSSFYSITINENNQLASAYSIMSMIDPVFSSTTMSNFTPDLTVFVYKDSKGIWPGYILTISSTSNPTAIQKAMVSFESSNISGFYLTSNVGEFGPFKNGQLNGNPTRYTESNKGYSLDYGIWNNQNNQYVIFSTSYAGLGQAVKNIEGL